MTEKPNFRLAMNWLHTWFGVTLGTLLFTIWWMGTLSVFGKEIDRWMQPETRGLIAQEYIDADQVITKLKERHPGDELTSLLIQIPRERRPYFEVSGSFKEAGRFDDRLHPQIGEPLGEMTSRAASGFFYTMHYRLHIPGGVGYFTVAFATFFMMILLVTGVVIHRKIFVDFFTFRPQKKIRRSGLDLHNITGVLFLPFHFLICLSGFAIFAGFYIFLPFAISGAFSENDRAVELFYAADDYAYYNRDKVGEPAGMADIAPFVTRAEEIWSDRYGQASYADRIDLNKFGDKNAYVEVRRYFPHNRTEGHRDSINFDGVTGEILMDYQASPVRQVRTWLEGFHQIQFDHWLLRWLYFIAGLAGCILIATGFIFWVSSRIKKNEIKQPMKIRFVRAMGIGSVTGIVAATSAYMVANRVLPLDASFAELSRMQLEIRIFFLIWVFSFIHAVLRDKKAWAEQSWFIAAMCVVAVLLNWITTGDHLIRTMSNNMIQVAGVDIALIASAAMAVFCAKRLQENAVQNALSATRKKKITSNPTLLENSQGTDAESPVD